MIELFGLFIKELERKMPNKYKIRKLEGRRFELSRNIQLCLSYKKKILDAFEELKEQYNLGIINYESYKGRVKTLLRERNLEQWFGYYDKKITEYKQQLDLCEKWIKGEEEKARYAPLAIVLTILIIMLSIAGVLFIKPTITGFTAGVIEESYAQTLGLTLNETTNYTWISENDGILKSARISGSIILEENTASAVRAYLEESLIMDSALLKKDEISPITGLVISEGDEIIANATEANTTITFNEICLETCILDLNKTKYQLKIVVENATINLETINYIIEKQIQPPQETNISIREEMIQGLAELNKPVSWTKKIYASETIPEITTLLLQKSSNIKATRIVNNTKEEIPQENLVVRETERGTELTIQQEIQEVEITFETEAPKSLEEDIEGGKRIVISGSDNIHYEDVLVYTTLPRETYQEKIRLYRTIEGISVSVGFTAYDNNTNGLVDRIEWKIPSLDDDQIYIIEISKAEHLAEDYTFISDIYDEVKALDGNWSEPINQNEYVRVTFERMLTAQNDITLYPRTISGNPKIEIYEFNQSRLIAEFSSLNDNEYNTVYLTGLEGSQDTFDLRVTEGVIEIDHIIDPIFGLFLETWEAANFNNWNNVNFATTTAQKIDTTSAVCAATLDCSMKTIVYINTTPATTITVSWWNMDDDLDTGGNTDAWIYFNDSGGNWDEMLALGEAAGSEDTWVYHEISSTDSQYLHRGFSINFTADPETGENLWLDNINVTYVDTRPPSWSNNQTNETVIYQNMYINFTTLWVDGNASLAGYTFMINQTGTWFNDSYKSFSGRSQANATNTSLITASGGEVVEWKFAANDTSGNRNETDLQKFTVASSNSAPNAPTGVILNSTSIAQTNYTDEDLSANFLCDDPDTSDTLTYNISFYKNGIINLSFGSQSCSDPQYASFILNNGNTTIGDKWAFAVNVSDDDGLSTGFVFSNNVTIANAAPTVGFVSSVASQTPSEATVTYFTFTFNATDPDGASDLTDSTANGRINITLNSTTNQRDNTTCNSLQSVGNTKEYECRIDLWYFDTPGSWTINASIKDNSGAYAENSSTTFTVNPLTAMVMSPVNLTWPQIGLTSTNTTSNNDPITINNTGNKIITNGNIRITAVNLRGETTTSEFLLVANFTVDYDTGVSPLLECDGTKLVNNTATGITIANVTIGNLSISSPASQEDLYFCLNAVTAGLSQQSYSTTSGTTYIYPWTISVS